MKKKEKVARPERLELPTLWFEARCSDPTELRARYGDYNRGEIIWANAL
jgi:hypothetical protein